ncbi:TonB-dependent receptor [Caulobacter segnis]|uniref:TonB-dependent receptor n=1 Tax=Caulobacter segnis TaxID=88688 RepID=UPI0028558914|nr:TonB-dependent receptor [Caulobacter segnis]MDR6626260.1 iron complex outermembrane receptor protein [Caulobacter segnis]
MKYQITRGRLLATTMIAGVAALAGFAANAQTAAPAAQPAAEQNNEIDAVVITGSLLRRTDTATPSPVTVQTSEQLKAQGITTVADAIRSLSADNSGSIPAAFGSGFAAGSTGVSLRGLSVNSTLVMIDGLRNANYPLADDGQKAFVDLNSIPFNAVERIETLKDGASSLYGADAIGGVVNIIMKSNYQGMSADASYGTSQHGGGDQYRFNADIGHGDLETDKYNVYFDVEYQLDKRIRGNQRGFPFNTNDLSSIPGGSNDNPQTGGSTFYGNVKRATLTTPGNLATGLAIDSPTNVWQPLRTCAADAPLTTQYDEDGALMGSYCAQNIANLNDIQPKQSRIGTYGRFTFKPTDNLEAYISGSFVQSKTSVNGTPVSISSSTPNNLSNLVLPVYVCSSGVSCATAADRRLNPNNPFAASGDYALIKYRFSDLPASANYTNRMFRMVGGVKGMAAEWNYQANLVIAHANLESAQSGFLSYKQLMSDINTGAYNFIDPSKNSQAVRAALSPVLAKTSTSDLDSINVQASRPLFSLPGGDAQLGVGGEFRYEATNDPALNPVNDAQGLGNARTQGNRTVASAFAELGLPVLNQVEVNLSGRYDHYSDFGDNFSPKLGVKYTPIKSLALRGTVSKGFRAPSFSEAGNSASQGFTTFSFRGDQYAAFREAHGNNEYTKAYSLSSITTANPDLKPEKSTSYTFGAVWAPTRTFSVSLDYYHIKKTDVIAQASAGTALAAYYAGQAIPAGYVVTPDAVDPEHPTALPRVLSVASPYINADSLVTSGLDLNVQASFFLPADVKWTTNVEATTIFDYRYTQDGNTYDYVGTEAPYVLSSGAGTPKNRLQWTNTFERGPIRVTGVMSYVSGMRQGDDSYQEGCLYGDTDFNCRIKSFTTVDLTGAYDVTDKATVYADVMNLFDAGPMFNPANYAGVNWNPTYSQSGIVGRYFRVGMRVKY